jgi:predicted TIM-barrel fold metal-dependent hydrolase
LRAIDIHVHAGIGPDTRGVGEMADHYRQIDVLALPIAWDEETRSGRPRLDNDTLARIVKENSDVFISGWACIDPWKGQMAIKEAEHTIKDLGLLGLKFQQDAQAFYPNDRRFYPLWEKCVELKAPVMFHMGTTAYGVGQPGGAGIHLKYAQPIPYLDDVAADFPNLTIIGAHPAWPWQEEMLAIVLHKSNVFIDLSGWSPKYFPESLKREVNGRLQDRALFGSDHPFVPVDRWLSDFEKEVYKPEVVEKVLYKNAQRILGLRSREGLGGL